MMVPFFNAPATYPEALASTNKCLAQSNNSCAGDTATKKQSTSVVHLRYSSGGKAWTK
jgi:hypothetical protein